MRRTSRRTSCQLAAAAGLVVSGFAFNNALGQVLPGTPVSMTDTGSQFPVATNVTGDPNPADSWLQVLTTGGIGYNNTPSPGYIAGQSQFYNQIILHVNDTDAMSYYNLDAYKTLNFSIIFPTPQANDPSFFLLGGDGDTGDADTSSFGVNIQGASGAQQGLQTVYVPNPTSSTTAAKGALPAHNTEVNFSIDLTDLGNFGAGSGPFGPEEPWEQATAGGTPNYNNYLNLYLVFDYGYNDEFSEDDPTGVQPAGSEVNPNPAYAPGWPSPAPYTAGGTAAPISAAPADGQTFYMGNMFFTSPVAQSNSTFTGASGSNWSSSGGWGGTTPGVVPTNMGDLATFSGASVPTTVNLDSDETVGQITFQNNTPYTIASTGGTLDLFNYGGWTAYAGVNGASTNAEILVNYGGSANVTHLITAPVYLGSDVLLSVTNPADGLKISGNISGIGGVIVGGSGTVTLSGTNTYPADTTVFSGTLVLGNKLALPPTGELSIGGNASIATVQFAPGIGRVAIGTLNPLGGSTPSYPDQGLLINAGSTLDITNNSFVYNYAGATDPISTIKSEIASAAANNGSENLWTGAGITSSTAAKSNGKFSIGYLDGNLASDNTTNNPIAHNAVIVAYTLTGDAFLEGSVGFDDLLTVAQNYGAPSGRDWAQGSFDYSGAVGFGDLLSVAQNYGSTFAISHGDAPSGGGVLALAWNTGSVSAVPEPTSIGLAAVAVTGLLARRRRR